MGRLNWLRAEPALRQGFGIAREPLPLRASDGLFNAHFFSKRNEPKKILLSPNPLLHIKGLNWKSQKPPIFRFFSGRIDRQRSILTFLMKIDILPIFMVHTTIFLFVLLFKRIRLSYDFVFNAYHQRVSKHRLTSQHHSIAESFDAFILCRTRHRILKMTSRTSDGPSRRSKQE